MSKPNAPASSRENILAHLRTAKHRLSAADIAEALGCKPVRIAAQLKALTDAGRVVRLSENQCYVYLAQPATPHSQSQAAA